MNPDPDAFQFIGEVVAGTIIFGGCIAAWLCVESHAQEKDRIARERNGSAQISALRAAAVKGDALDIQA